MYKVFFNDSSVQFSTEIKKSLNHNIVKIVNFDDYDFVNQIVSEIECSSVPIDFIVEHSDVEKVWRHFKEHFKELPAAGGLVKNRRGEFLFIRRFGLWDLPKGKIEKKETSEMAAVREVEEECGLTGLTIVESLQSTYHIYWSPFLKQHKNLVLKETKWFLMDYSGDETPVPQTSEDIVEARWVAPSEFETVMENTYESLKELFKRVVR